MKRFLRAACGAAMLLLLLSPMKTPAASTPEASEPLGGNTQFDVNVLERYHYLHVQVMDGDDHIPLAGIPVEVYPAGASVPVGTGTSDGNGQVTFQLDKNPSTQYDLEMGQGVAGFHPYRMEGITLPFKHTAVWENPTGVIDPNDPNPIPTPDLRDGGYGILELKPLHFPVTYEGGEHGNIQAGHVEHVRYGKSPTAENLQIEVPDEYHVDGWLLPGDPVPKKLNTISVTAPLTLTAHYVRQFLVTYTAGDYGYLDGVTSERVVAGEKPAHVPRPVPMSEREYRFVKWRFDKPFSYNSIDPATVTINGDTAFEAVFDVRKRQPVIVNTPTEPGQPGADQPSSAPAAVPGGVGGPGAGGGPGAIGGPGAAYGAAAGKSADLTGASAGETPPSGQETKPTAPGQEGTQPGDGSGENPSGPASVQADSNTRSPWLHWLILVCCLLTLAGGLMRLRAIRRIGRKEGEKAQDTGMRAVVTEVVLGLISLILWGYFFSMHSSAWDLAALTLWAGELAAMTVLLVRGEYRLRRRK